MRIGIDISMLVYHGSGVATYTYQLVKALLRYQPEHEYRLFYSSLRRPQDVTEKLDEFRSLGGSVYDYPLPPRVLKYAWNRKHFLNVERLIGEVDVYHSSDFLRPPLHKDTKAMTTIHDLTWKVHPEFHTEDIVKAHERKLDKTLKYGDTIIVDSENTKKDLLKYYPEAENNGVYVIYLGVDERFRPIEDEAAIQEVLSKYGVEYPKRYLLYVGAIEPRKNLDTAVKAYADLIKDADYADVEFLIVGRAGWKNEELFQLIDKLGIKDKVHFVGYVEDDDLPYFYNAAKVFVYLSKYEGFGLPLLESQACGCPVLGLDIATNRSFLKDSLVLANGEVGELSESIAYLIENEEKYTHTGLINSRRFTWRSTAQKTLTVIEER